LHDIVTARLLDDRARLVAARAQQTAATPLAADSPGSVSGKAPTISSPRHIGFVVPAQTFFGPVTFLLYLWWRRTGAEAPMSAWLNRARATTTANPSPVTAKAVELAPAGQH
jgi:hypothetical protein